jgi:hypothetical protein
VTCLRLTHSLSVLHNGERHGHVESFCDSALVTIPAVKSAHPEFPPTVRSTHIFVV